MMFISDYCPSGFEVESVGNCAICPRDQYKDNTIDIQGFCTDCPPNKRAATTGATAEANCTICKFGKVYTHEYIKWRVNLHGETIGFC